MKVKYKRYTLTPDGDIAPTWWDVLFAFPGWLLTLLLLQFVPADHPWKRPGETTLRKWAMMRTALCMTFDAVWWAWLVTTFTTACIYIWRHA